ncbi:hypothetical protein F5I97DRAFT_1181971 [Phlebopus sp. FC_14]|nr:hypothetical protein F5I97DRAFT_1181971 [Phlebopus sp. FC_14]
MSALKFAVSALNREKPHSSITDWVEILTSQTYADEAYDGIPELVASISFQATGPAEASRALRKKIKHGNSHQKYRALAILKALMENGDHKFQTTCMDDQLIDAVKHLASDPLTETKVKKKLLSVLASWNTQFKDDPSMSTVAGLYRQCRPPDRRSLGNNSGPFDGGASLSERKEKEEKEAAKRRAKQEKEEAKERARKAEEDARRKKSRPQRAPFNFEKEKPQILTAIANASQASSNLANAIMLVDGDKESIVTNQRVQECLQNAKVARKPIVRYIQLVENEEVIGTLIETHERIISTLQMYDNFSADSSTDPVTKIQAGVDAVNISSGELSKLQDQQRAAVERALQQRSVHPGDDLHSHEDSGYVHPDLQDLSFGALGNEQGSLPPPMKPSARHATSGEAAWDDGRGSLSDFSDYESDEEGQQSDNAHQAGPSSGVHARGKHVDVEDPFADPFAD